MENSTDQSQPLNWEIMDGKNAGQSVMSFPFEGEWLIASEILVRFLYRKAPEMEPVVRWVQGQKKRLQINGAEHKDWVIEKQGKSGRRSGQRAGMEWHEQKSLPPRRDSEVGSAK